MMSSANLAFSIYPLLSAGAADAVHLHGTEALKALYLPKMALGRMVGDDEPDRAATAALISA